MGFFYHFPEACMGVGRDRGHGGGRHMDSCCPGVFLGAFETLYEGNEFGLVSYPALGSLKNLPWIRGPSLSVLSTQLLTGPSIVFFLYRKLVFLNPPDGQITWSESEGIKLKDSGTATKQLVRIPSSPCSVRRSTTSLGGWGNEAFSPLPHNTYLAE